MIYRCLPLNGLRAFEAAARHRSFKKAAEELFVTPTAVSHQIKALEDSLGVQLFHRLTRALSLTADGEAILPKVSEGLKCLKAAIELSRTTPEVTILSVTAPPTFAARWLVPRLSGFNQAHPEVEMHLSSSFRMIDAANRRPASPVDAGESHGGTSIAVRFGYGRYTDCRVDLVFAADYFPMCSPSLLKAKRPLRAPQDLRWHVLIHDETIPDEASRPTWDEWFKVAGVTGVNAHHGPRFRDVSLALEAACDGQGVVLAMEPVARREIAAGRLVIPFATPLRARLAFYLVTPEADAEEPAVVAFREWLLSEAAKEPGRAAVTELAASWASLPAVLSRWKNIPERKMRPAQGDRVLRGRRRSHHAQFEDAECGDG